MDSHPLVVGCVADQPPYLLEQAWRLLLSWRKNAGRWRDVPFLLGVAGGVPEDFARRVAPFGAILVSVEQLTPRHPPSNKLQWFAPASRIKAERYVLLDCDTWVCKQPDGLLGAEPLRAKLADIATVTDVIFEKVFVAAGIPKPPTEHTLSIRGEASITYLNAGVLSLSASALQHLLPRWRHWNHWLDTRPELLADCFPFLEQASLSLTIAELGLPVGLLDDSLNFPGHFKDPVPPALTAIEPRILHYHKETDENGRFLDSPLPLVQKHIVHANASLFAAWRELAFDLSQERAVARDGLRKLLSQLRRRWLQSS
ncbi:MAG: hypothetical protein AB7T01_10255 [Acidithiobacillus sp.]